MARRKMSTEEMLRKYSKKASCHTCGKEFFIDKNNDSKPEDLICSRKCAEI